ncbi:MAG: pyridoxal-dependent decarboxylase, partial [Actinomycetota bacterium]|nr:pyridoxal-dependent decarboxylase [Actinomycetota bacterium]
MNDDLFLTGSPESESTLRALLDQVSELIISDARLSSKPISPPGSPMPPVDYSAADIFPELGVGMRNAWATLGASVIASSVAVSSPTYVAHYLAPPLIQSAVAEFVIGALNQSLDSYDQGPAATALELAVIQLCCHELGLTDGDGVFTAGASMSNLMGLLLARENAARKGSEVRLLVSAQAHLSIALAAQIIGLNPKSVVIVPSAPGGGMDPFALERQLRSASVAGTSAIIAVTIGTTDSGASDPVEFACDLAEEQDSWVHLDAAATGALALSRAHRSLLGDISRCDSIALDFHKLGWQSVSSGCFFVRDATSLELIRHHADYLNP